MKTGDLYRMPGGSVTHVCRHTCGFGTAERPPDPEDIVTSLCGQTTRTEWSKPPLAAGRPCKRCQYERSRLTLLNAALGLPWPSPRAARAAGEVSGGE